MNQLEEAMSLLCCARDQFEDLISPGLIEDEAVRPPLNRMNKAINAYKPAPAPIMPARRDE